MIDKIMTATDKRFAADTGALHAAIVGKIIPTDEVKRLAASREISAQWSRFGRSGAAFGPAVTLAWLLGVLGVAACFTPWQTQGRIWLALVAAIVVLLAAYDAIALWLASNEFVPVVLSPEKGLRGREGQGIQVPLALAGTGRHQFNNELEVAIMAATRESEAAMQVKTGPQRLKLAGLDPPQGGPLANSTSIHLWPWTPEIALLRRGLWPGPRVGIEQRSRFGIWQLRRWFDSPVPVRIDADLRPGRREILRSPIYRAFVATRESPWTGHGRDFERLREYQPGDNYAEIAWKSTARRGAPVTRLFQWEQKQEIYFVLDQSRASALAFDWASNGEGNQPPARALRRLLDLAVETALVGATVALEAGDEFGLITYAEEPKSWLRAGCGQFHFQQFRDRLLNIEPLPTTANYESLFSEIRLRLRRRAYLVLLTDLTERSVSDSLCRGVALVRSSHVVLVTSILPAHTRPAFSAGEEPKTDQDVYAALAGEKENQRLGALARQLGELDIRLRFVPPRIFLRTVVEGYLEGKREQRL
jgi:uncharacterized protein (DUF58 family)